MRTSFGLGSSLALLLALAAPAVAQTPVAAPAAAQKPTAAPELSRQDVSFAKEAANGGMAEVEYGKLAALNAQSEQVKQFGARMVQDHGNANKQLGVVIGTKGLPMPMKLDPKHEQLRDRLAKLRGAEFDRAYMREMVKDHDEDMKAFSQAAQTVQDPELKKFAEQTLKVIEQHDKLAKDVDHSLTATGSSRPPR